MSACPLNPSSAHYLSAQLATYIPGMIFREEINVAELPLIVYLSSSSAVIESFRAVGYAHIAIMKPKNQYIFIIFCEFDRGRYHIL
jgi:hypothetical protein